VVAFWLLQPVFWLPPGCLLAVSWLLLVACCLRCFWLLAACSWLIPGCAFGLPRQRPRNILIRGFSFNKLPESILIRGFLLKGHPGWLVVAWLLQAVFCLPPGCLLAVSWLLGCLLAFGVPRQRVPAAKLGSKIYSSLQKATPASKIQKRKRALSEEKV
jgi:hypothetical protein